MLLISLHLLTVLPAALLGAYLLASRKGTPRHRALGKGYMVLMLAPGRMIHGWLFGSQQAGTPASVAGGAVN